MPKREKKKINLLNLNVKKKKKEKEILEKRVLDEEDVNSDINFREFIAPSIGSLESLPKNKSNSFRIMEKEESKFEKQDFTPSDSKEYNFFSPREEKKQEIFSKPAEPKRVNFVDMGRDFRIFQREFLEKETLPFSSEEIGKSKDYFLERVDFTEVGREKRYKLMK
jgi:hypothetical protein